MNNARVKLLAAGAGLLINAAALGAAANHATSEVKLTKNPVAFTGQDNRQYQSQIMTTTKSYFPDRPWFLFLATVSGIGALACAWKAFDDETSKETKPSKTPVAKPLQQLIQTKTPVTIIPVEKEEEEDDQDYLEEDDDEIEEDEFDTEELSTTLVVRSNTVVTTLDSIRQQQENQDWIHPLVFHEDKSFRTQHFHICGATNSGKTTLISYVVDLIANELSTVELFLINPKHIESEVQWSFDPFVKDIEDVLAGLEHVWQQVKNRLQDPTFNKHTSPKIIAIIDEWDWIYEEYKAKARSIVRKIVKVGRALNVHVILSGQSALCNETGFSTSDYENVGRIVLAGQAIKLLGNTKSFPYDKQFRQELYQVAQRYKQESRRFALVVPMDSMPFVSPVPHIELEERTPEKELVAANG